jgi:hypothetical protein
VRTGLFGSGESDAVHHGSAEGLGGAALVAIGANGAADTHHGSAAEGEGNRLPHTEQAASAEGRKSLGPTFSLQKGHSAMMVIPIDGQCEQPPTSCGIDLL